MLQIVLREAMADRGLSSHAAAAEIGVSHTTIIRALHGKSVDVDTIVKFADWLGVRPSELINSTSDTALADQLAVLLSHSRELEDVVRNAVARVQGGTLDANTLRDIIGYAVFKIQTASPGEQRKDGRKVSNPAEDRVPARSRSRRPRVNQSSR